MESTFLLWFRVSISKGGKTHRVLVGKLEVVNVDQQAVDTSECVFFWRVKLE